MLYVYIFIAIAIIAVIYKAVSANKGDHPLNGHEKANRFKKEAESYRYFVKSSIMTQHEQRFFTNLSTVNNGRYFIVPQAHLSSFLSHTVKGQNWKAAFSRINGKSVDFLFCSPDTMKPLFAVELDDATHLREDRVTRDAFVEQALKNANIPLIRINDGQWESLETLQAVITQALTARY